MTTVHTLASGSSGNALLISAGSFHALVDVGISCRRITTSLQELGLTPADLDAVFISHIHTDHTSGLQVLLKKTTCPIRAFDRTCRELKARLTGIGDRLSPMDPCEAYAVGTTSVTAFPLSHDAPGTCGFRFDTAEGSVGILTDTGYVPDRAADILFGVDLAVLEANHDVETLLSGPYPHYLKQRILDAEGHLCNEDAARFAVELVKHGTSEIILAHLSRENNTPAMARNAVERALSAAGLAPELSVAPRDTLSSPHIVHRRTVCKK